jgi:hypothetical protein
MSVFSKRTIVFFITEKTNYKMITKWVLIMQNDLVIYIPLFVFYKSLTKTCNFQKAAQSMYVNSRPIGENFDNSGPPA